MSSSWLYLYVPKAPISYKGRIINAVIASGMNGLAGLFAYSVNMDYDKDFRRLPLHSASPEVMQAVGLLLTPILQHSDTSDFLCLLTDDLHQRFLVTPAKSNIDTEDFSVLLITIPDVTIADNTAFQLLMDSFWDDVNKRQDDLELLCRSYYDQLQLECLSFAKHYAIPAELLWSMLLDINPDVITARYNHTQNNTRAAVIWFFFLCLACVAILFSIVRS